MKSQLPAKWPACCRKFLRTGNGGEGNIFDSIVLRKGSGALDHAWRDVHSQHFLKPAGERNGETSDSAT